MSDTIRDLVREMNYYRSLFRRLWREHLLRPRDEGESRRKWLASITWSWARFLFWSAVFIVCIPLFIMEWLDNAHEDAICAEAERKWMLEWGDHPNI